MKNYVKPSDLYGDRFKIVRFLKEHGTNELYVTVKFHLPNCGIDTEVTIPMTDVKSRKFRDYIPDAFAMEGVRTSDQPEWLRSDINDALASATVETMLPQGFSFIDNRWVYALGNIVLNNSSGTYYTQDPLNLQLNESDLNFQDLSSTLDWLKIFCEQGPAQSALLLCALTPFIRPITERLCFPTRVVNAYIWGQSGTGKTEYAKLVSSLCKTSEAQGTNLSCSLKTILDVLSQYQDYPFLIDDLNRTESSREFEKKKSRLSEVIQRSHSAGQLSGNDEAKVDLSRTPLIITAEHLLNSNSSLSRCLVILMNDPFDPETLTYLQNERLQFIRLIMSFTEYICQEATQLSHDVSCLLDNNEFDMRIPHEDATMYSGFQRVVCTHKLLQCARYLLMRFWKDCGLSQESESWCVLQKHLQEGIKQAIGHTLMHIKRPDDITSPILKAVIDVFAFDRNGIVSKNYDDFQTLPAQVIFRNKNFFYFPGELLAGYLCGMNQTEISNKALISELKKAFLLTPYGQEWSSKLSPKIEKKKKAKGRFFRINVDTIVHRVRETYPNTAFFTSPVKELRPSAKK